MACGIYADFYPFSTFLKVRKEELLKEKPNLHNQGAVHDLYIGTAFFLWCSISRLTEPVFPLAESCRHYHGGNCMPACQKGAPVTILRGAFHRLKKTLPPFKAHNE
jgi:hypothetical protein